LNKYKLGIDVGGTFTDGVLIEENTGEVTNVKVPSTPHDPSEGFLNNLDRLIELSGLNPDEVWFLVHGTTVATNSIIEGNTAKTVFITTKGFKDILEIAFQIRPNLYDPYTEKPKPLIPRNLCFEVTERMGHEGEIIEPLIEEDVYEIIEKIKDMEVESVVVCLLHSYINDAHEKRIKELIEESCPGIPITLSSVICPEFREYTRASTSVINGAIVPIVSRYLEKIEKGLRERGFSVDCYLMQSSGGIVSSEIAKSEPCRIIESGPAAGVIIASYIAQQTGLDDTLCIDIGGTTAKVGMILNKQPKISSEFAVGAAAFSRSTAKRASGYPLRTPAIDLVEIGAGGGSIAWVDSGGILRVGPQSAGADPGPACYPNGGEKPTLTDANLILGRLNPDYFIGGEMKLDVQRSFAAIKQYCSDRLNYNEVETAAGIIDVAISNMVNAIRLISVEKGYDPRDFALVATGGAGPLHANLLADELDIPRIIIPPSPGLASALGLLVTDIKQELSSTVLNVKDIAWERIEEIIDDLSKRVKALLLKQGVKEDRIKLIPSADMRYKGQSYELEVPIESALKKDDLSTLFHKEHERAYGFSAEEEKTEIVNLKVTGIGSVLKHKPHEIKTGAKTPPKAAEKEMRKVYFKRTNGAVDCKIYDRKQLLCNNIIEGPAVVEEVDSTTIILPDYKGEIDNFGNLILSKR